VDYVFKIHQERAALADELSSLNDQEIILKIRDAPTRVKARSKQLLEKLDKLGVTLDTNGNVDYSNVKIPKELKILKENEPLIKVVLMEKDLKFEYPHMVGKMLQLIDRPSALAEKPKDLLTYELYYGIDPSSILIKKTSIK